MNKQKRKEKGYQSFEGIRSF